MQLTATAARPPPAPHRHPADTDGMAVASFVLGLLGLLVLNVVLGPIAIVLASVALSRARPAAGRALLGLGLGVADLVVLVPCQRDQFPGASDARAARPPWRAFRAPARSGR